MKNLFSLLFKSLSDIFGSAQAKPKAKNRPPVTAVPMAVKPATQPAQQEAASSAHREKHVGNPKEVQNRAYYLWVKNGRRHGHDQKDWYEAEKEFALSK
jgi:hypothetical protein